MLTALALPCRQHGTSMRNEHAITLEEAGQKQMSAPALKVSAHTSAGLKPFFL